MIGQLHVEAFSTDPPQKRPCATLARLVGQSTNTAWSTPASCRVFFSWLSGIRAGWLIFLSLRGPSPQALTFFGGVSFTAWSLKRSSLGEYRRSPRHFWSRPTRVGSGPSPGPTLKASCHTRFIAWRLRLLF